MRLIRYFIFLFFTISTISCNKVSKESILELLNSRSVYSNYFYAPIHIGFQAVTLDPGVKLQDYINERYGIVVQAGLMDIDIVRESSWRNVYNVKLTEKAMNLCDPRRSDEEHAFVPVCRIVPIMVDTIVPLEDKSIECKYIIEQTSITPFGEFLGYEDGKRFSVTDTLSKL